MGNWTARLVILLALGAIVPACHQGDDGAPGPAGSSGAGGSGPVIQTLSVSPTPAYKGNTYSASVSASDPNGDLLTYAWTVPAGHVIASGQGTSTVTILAGAFVNGLVSVSVGDGTSSANGAAYVRVIGGSWEGPAVVHIPEGGLTVEADFAADASGTAIAIWVQGGRLYARRFVPGVGWGGPETVSAADATGVSLAMDGSGNATAVWRRIGGGDGIYASRYVSGAGWSAPVELVGVAGSPLQPQVAMNASGNAVAVWVADDGTADSIYASFYTAGVGWSAPQAIESSGLVSFLPRVGIDSGGNAVAVWMEFDGVAMASNVLANRYVAGTGWGTEQLIEGGTGTAAEADLAVDPAGNAFAVWRQFDGAVHSIYANRYVAGTGWGTEIPIESSSLSAQGPDVGADASGNAIAVWLESDPMGPVNNVWANRYVAGTGWGTETSIESNMPSALYPRVAVNGAGDALATWSLDTDYYANRYTVGSGWGTSEQVAALSTGFPPFPAIPAVDGAGTAAVACFGYDFTSGLDRLLVARREGGVPPWTVLGVDLNPEIADPHSAGSDFTGNVIVVWAESDGVRSDIWAARYVAGIGWGAPERIESSLADARQPQVAVDPAGNAVAVWAQADGGVYSVYGSRYVAGIGWGAPQLIESGAGTASVPQVVVDANGTAVAIWVQDEGGMSRVRANRYVVGSGWGTAAAIDAGSLPAFYPRLAGDDGGNALALWLDFDSGASTHTVRASRYVAGGGWGGVATVGSAGLAGTLPELAASAGGDAVAVWMEYDFANARFDVRASRFAVASGWGPAIPLESGSASGTGIHVGMDSGGNAVAVWTQDNDVFSRRYLAGVGWVATELLDAGTVAPVSPQAAVDASGNAVAVWLRDDAPPGGNDLHAMRYEAGTNWGAEQLLETGTAFARGPKSTVAGNGEVTVVWWQGGELRANRFR